MQCLGSSPGSSDQFRVTHLLPHLQQQSKPKFLLLFLKRRLHAMLPRGTWQKDGLKGSLPSRVALPSRAPARLYYCASARAHLLPHLLEQPNPKFCFFSKKKAACNASPTWHVDLNIVHGSIYHIDTRNMTFFFFFFLSLSLLRLKCSVSITSRFFSATFQTERKRKKNGVFVF